jgi:hypothetical protein
MTVNDSNGGLAVLAFGAVTAADPAEFSRNGPSFYADPASWLVTAAAQDALSTCAENLLSASDEVGMVTVSNVCTTLTMRDIARAVSRGRVSPLRFAGANPGVLTGLPCIKWKFRGPTLTFSMDPVVGVDVAVTVVKSWLRNGQAKYVLIATYLVEHGQHVARCVITRRTDADGPDGRREVEQLLTLPSAAVYLNVR